MLRGVRFTGNGGGDFFPNLDSLMDVSMYDWYIDDVDLNYLYYRDGRYSGLEFQKALSELPALSFARVRRYPVGLDVNPIDTYEEYLASSCDVFILFYDGGYYDVYTKEEDLSHRTYQLCVERGYDDVEYIEDGKDGRYRMHF